VESSAGGTVHHAKRAFLAISVRIVRTMFAKTGNALFHQKLALGTALVMGSAIFYILMATYCHQTNVV